MVNGYVTLDLASPTIYADALGALKQDKPVLVYDEPECYYADTIKATTIDDEPVVQITKGGKTITIANDNTITNNGDIQLKQMHYNEFDISDFSHDNNNLDTDYMILICEYNLDDVKYSELPNGTYPLIAHLGQSELDGSTPLYLQKNDNTITITTNENNDYVITISGDNNFHCIM